MLKRVISMTACGCRSCAVAMRTVNSWMLRPDVILKYRILYASAVQVAREETNEQENKGEKEGEEDRKKGCNK